MKKTILQIFLQNNSGVFNLKVCNSLYSLDVCEEPASRARVHMWKPAMMPEGRVGWAKFNLVEEKECEVSVCSMSIRREACHEQDSWLYWDCQDIMSVYIRVPSVPGSALYPRLNQKLQGFFCVMCRVDSLIMPNILDDRGWRRRWPSGQ